MSYDEDRYVELDDDAPVLPPHGEGSRVAGRRPDFSERSLWEQTTDDTSRGWGEVPEQNDERLLEDRPPHWD